MGSTVVAVIARDDAAEIVWVGDSRAYLWRAGALSRVTRDHSVGELLREHNRLSEEEIRVHPQRDLVTQTLGHHEPHPGSVALDLRAGDTILLCSDGLHGELRDDEIAAVLKDTIALDETADRLVDGALAKGGRDNVSVILLTVPGDGVARLLAPAANDRTTVAAGIARSNRCPRRRHARSVDRRETLMSQISRQRAVLIRSRAPREDGVATSLV